MTTSFQGCEYFNSVAAELALGSLTGAERSAALAHADECPECRATLSGFSSAADALLLAAPEMDPPAGFEVRLLARLHEQVGSSVAGTGEDVRGLRPTGSASDSLARVIPIASRRRHISIAAVAASVVFVAAGLGIGLAVSPHAPSQQAASGLRIASLHVGTSLSAETDGAVVITKGSPTTVLMTFSDPAWSGLVRCVVTSGGHAVDIGSYYIDGGATSWTATTKIAGSSISGAQVVSSTGRVLATADLS
jgi:hypothetical protein